MSQTTLRLEEFKNLLSEGHSWFWQKLITGENTDGVIKVKVLHSAFYFIWPAQGKKSYPFPQQKKRLSYKVLKKR